MASLEEIEKIFKQNEQYVIINQSRIETYVNDQRQREAEIINKTNSFCPFEKLVDRTTRAEDIQKALYAGYGDANILRSIMCMNNSLSLFPGGVSISRSRKIRDFIRNLRQIGEESEEGYAMLADIKGKVQEGKNLMVVKSPRRIDAELRANQIHEYFVGVYGTNKLRSNIPNFAFVLGFFQCSPPYIDKYSYLMDPSRPINTAAAKTRQALTYCQNDISDNQVNYLLYENVSNSKTFREFIIDGCTLEQYLNVLTQITLAIDMAQESINFTHYDLHDENVLVRELPEEIFISYTIDSKGTTQYLRTKYVATIIDFGRSHIKFDGRNYGYSMIEIGLFPDRAYPMYDIYKILLFSLNTALFGNRDMEEFAGMTDDDMANRKIIHNPDVYLNARELVAYFYPQLPRNLFNKLYTVGDYLIKTRDFFYSLPLIKTFAIPARYFYRYGIAKVFPNIFNRFIFDGPVPAEHLYGCSRKGLCISLESALAEISKPDINYAYDPYTFYEILIERKIIKSSKDAVEMGPIQSAQGLAIYNEGKTLFRDHMNKLIKDAQEHLTQYNLLSKGLHLVSLSEGVSVSIRFRQDFLETYRRFVAKIVGMIDQLTSFANIEIIVTTLIRIYPDEANSIIPGINITYAQLPSILFAPNYSTAVVLNKAIRSIQKDVQYINSLDRSMKKDILQMNPRARWLFEKMPSLTSSITQFSI